MTTRHSLFTRGLSLLLAFCMLLSNMGGLTLRAEAADQTLYDVLDEQLSGVNNNLLNALANAEAVLPVVADMLSEPVETPEYPEEIPGTMVNGYLTLEPINGWVPTYYWDDAAGTDVPYTSPVQLDEELESVTVTYEYDLGVAAQAEAVYSYLKVAGNEAVYQAGLLDSVSDSDALTALDFLDVNFIGGMIDTVDELTAEEMETSEDELEDIKTEWKAIIAQLLDRVLDSGDYEDYLLIYSMLDQYASEGLPFYYQDSASINYELEAMADILDEILSYGESVVDALIDKMGYSSNVKAYHLAEMADRMHDAADGLYSSIQIDTNNVSALEALFGAGIPVANLTYSSVEAITVTEWYDVYNEIVEETEPTTAPTEPEVTEPEAGTAENPIILGWQQAYDAELNTAMLGAYVIPAGETVYFQDYRLGGLQMTASLATAENEFLDFTITVDGVEIPVFNADGAHQGVIAGGNPMMPNTIAVTNTSDKDGNLWFFFIYPFGSQNNPYMLEMDVNVADIKAGSEGCYFVYFAEADGYLVVEMPEDGWTYALSNVTAGIYNDTQWYDQSPYIGYIAVSEGDRIDLMVNSYDPENPWNAPARTISFGASLESEIPVIPEPEPEPEPELGSEENPIVLEFVWDNDFMAHTLGYSVPAGKTVYLQAYGLGGLNVVAMLSAGPNMLDGTVVMNGAEMPAVAAGTFNAVATGNPRMPTTFAVTNNSETDGKIFFNVNHILGSQMNPEVIESMSYNVASVSLAEGDDDGYYYTYTAEGDGTVTFYFGYMEDAPEADIVVMNNNTYQQKSLLMDGVDNYGLELTMDVSKGDVLMIQVVVVPDESWNIPAADLEWIGNYTAVPGTEANPFEIEWIWNDAYTEATATVEVAAGATVYYNAMTGMIMTVNGEEFAVEGMTFCLTNEGEEAAVYELAVSYPVGTYENPDQLVLGENTAKVEENTWGYYFTWTAEADGTLSVTMPEGDWFYVINSNGVDPEDWSDDVYGEGQYSDQDPVNPGTIDVVAGENVIVQVNTYDPASWDTPAGTITFTAAFDMQCKHEYTYACDKTCALCGELTNEEAAHSIKHVDPIEVTCYENGQAEYWYCEFCGSAWLDAECTMVTNLKSVVIPAAHTSVEHVAESCYNTEYWVCEDCQSYWADEALVIMTNSKNVIKAVPSHNLTHVEESCYNTEHWFCDICEIYWADEALTQITNAKNVIKAEATHNLTHVAESCYNTEHWFCDACEIYWADEALTQITNSKNVIKAVPSHELDHTAEGCYNVEFWKCSICDGYWTDEACTQLTNRLSVIKAAPTHALEHTAAVAATCFEDGNVEYWHCTACAGYWTDAACTKLTNRLSVVTPKGHAPLTHVERVESTCFENGNIEYWTCEDCGYAWLDAEGTLNTNLLAVVLPSGCKTIKHVRAVAPTCTTEGNVKYWFCPDCERYWTDKDCTQLTNRLSVILPADCQNIVHVKAVEATCFENGNIEHWYCEDCLTFWQDANRLQITNSKNVVTPMGHAPLTHVSAKAATCTENGNIEYWYCEDCNYAWLDAEGTRNTNLKAVVTPAAHGEIKHHDPIRAICGRDGQLEYWECEVCHTMWSDEACTQETNAVEVFIKGTHIGKALSWILQKLTRSSEADGTVCVEFDCVYCNEKQIIPAEPVANVIKEATCTDTGVVENVPTVVLNGQAFTPKDESVEIEIEKEDGSVETETATVENKDNIQIEVVEVEAKGHNYEFVPGVEGTCHTDGNLAYWYCTDEECGEIFIGEDKPAEGATTTDKLEDTVIPATKPEVIHVEGDTCVTEHWYCTAGCGQTWLDEELTVLATEDYALVNHDLEKVDESCWNVEYWHCADCGGYWIDNMSMPSNSKRVIKYPATHEIVEVEAVAKTCYEEGNIAYWYCELCNTVWADEALTQLTNFKNVVTPASHGEIVHVEAKAATCFENGNIEHWYCADCGQAWLDADCTLNTNLKAVILPMAHAPLTHVEAKAATCFEDGNIEYWFCADCGYAWLDAEGTLNTNLKAVVLPMAHAPLTHVEAVAPTCESEGNIEYWTCEACGYAWLDAEGTLNTNLKAVVLPATHTGVVHVEESCYNTEYWVCEDCETYFADETLIMITNSKNVIKAVPTHAAEHMAETCYNIEHWICYACEGVWTDEACTQVTNVKNVIKAAPSHEAEHVAETCYNTEYWTCELCEGYWTDEACTQVTNSKNVIKAVPSHELTHVEESCYNVEYWMCELCEGFWTDEACTQVTNSKNVIKAEPSHELIHVEAVAPNDVAGEYANGNVEYWYCSACEIFWANEELTQITNSKNVVVPSVDELRYNYEEALEYELNEEGTEFTAAVKLGRGIWTIQLPIDPEMDVFVNGEKVETMVSGGRAKRPGMSVTIEIINKNAADAEAVSYEITAKYPVGHRMNPAELAHAESINGNATLKAGTEGYYFVIDGAKYGTYYLTVAAGTAGYIYNEDTGIYSETITEGEAFAVAAADGQKIVIAVNTYDPDSWTAPAGEVNFTVTYKAPVKVNFRPNIDGRTLGTTVASGNYPIGYKLTEADLEQYAEAFEAWVENQTKANEYFFNIANLYANAGYVVKTSSNNRPVVITKAAFVDGVKYEVTDEGLISLENLGYTTEGMYQVKVNGTDTYNLKSNKETVKLNIGENNTVEILKKVTALEWLAMQLNSANIGTYVADGEAQTLVANITADDFVGFVQGLFDARFNDKTYTDVILGDEVFMESGALKINMNALVQAILADEQFTNESIIALGNNGKGALVHTTLTTPLFENVPFTINLTSAPAQMASAAEALEAAKSHFWFNGSDEGLQVFVRVPEKAYEALTGYEMITGMDKASVTAIANAAAQSYVEYMISMLQDESITTTTYTNTLKMLGVNKDLNGYANAYEFVQNIVTDAAFSYVPGEKTSTVNVAVQNAELLALLGMESFDEIMTGAGKLILDKDITAYTIVNIVNEVPTFDAIVIKKAKSVSALDMTTNLSAELASVSDAAVIMLIDDVNGDLVFNHTTILDLNGKTVNGSIVANAPVVIMDSSVETVSGATVTGTVSGDARILAGTYTDDVDAFLRDGYYQDDTGAVKNALFSIEAGKILVDSAIYTDNVDGYLPAAHYMAAEIALDVALNYFTGAALKATGKYAEEDLYHISIADLVGIVGRKSAGEVVDAVLETINEPAISGLANKIVADLINVDAVYQNLNSTNPINETPYTFASAPWTVDIYHETNGDYLTANIYAGDYKETVVLNLYVSGNTEKSITIPKTDLTVSIEDVLKEMSEIVVTEADVADEGTFIELNLNDIVRDGKALVVSGNADALVHLSFAHNENYNRILGAALAYFYEDLTMDLVKDGCIVELNQVLASLTVGEFFGTINKVVQNKEIPFEQIAAKLKLDLTANELAKLNKAYAMFQNGVAKVINKFELDVNESTPLSGLMDNNGRIVASGNIQYHDADAFYKGYGVKAAVEYVNAGLIIELAQGEHTIEHVEAKEATCFENGNIEYWYCTKCGYAWLDAGLTKNTNLKAVVLPMGHTNVKHVEAVAPTCYENGNIEYWYCEDCGYAWLDAECTLNTNLKAVILPMAHGEIIHVEAKAATCYENGNIEYWYCEDCGQAWLDAECTLNTNLKAVILPMAHMNIEHVEAKAATCVETGNIEYWYCTECGQAWLDAECTLNTNLKAVILPLGDHVAGEPVESKTEKPEYPCQSIWVTYCSVCGEEISREVRGGLWGDADCDGDVDNWDITYTARYSLGLISADKIHVEMLDVDGDGDVDNWDVTYVARKSLGLMEKFPVELR